MFWLVAALIAFAAISHTLALARHISARYRGYQLQDPWTFRQRLHEYAYQWFVPGLMVATVFALAVFAAFLYGSATAKPSDYWWKFLCTWWGLAAFFAVNNTCMFFEDRLSGLEAESHSFKEVVTYLLSPVPLGRED